MQPNYVTHIPAHILACMIHLSHIYHSSCTPHFMFPMYFHNHDFHCTPLLLAFLVTTILLENSYCRTANSLLIELLVHVLSNNYSNFIYSVSQLLTPFRRYFISTTQSHIAQTYYTKIYSPIRLVPYSNSYHHTSNISKLV